METKRHDVVVMVQFSNLIDGDGADGGVEHSAVHCEVLPKQLLRYDDARLGGKLHEDRGGRILCGCVRLHWLVSLCSPSNSTIGEMKQMHEKQKWCEIYAQIQNKI